jgi:hypothetical protein
MFEKNKKTTADGRRLYETLYGQPGGPEGRKQQPDDGEGVGGHAPRPTTSDLVKGAKRYLAEKKKGAAESWTVIRKGNVSRRYLDERPESEA